jgi:hypothetical protein
VALFAVLCCAVLRRSLVCLVQGWRNHHGSASKLRSFGSGKVVAASVAGTIAQSLLLPVHVVHIFSVH